MVLRCLLFSADEGTLAPILQVLTALGVEGERCSEAVATVDKITHQDFQIVIIDWDKQPEAALLLTAARERKAAERPLTLAIVSDDISVPQALQAGANSILRKPIMASQVRDTLATARDLLHSKKEPTAHAAQGVVAAAGPASTIPASVERGHDNKLRAGEFLQAGPAAPGGQFETESDVHESLKPFSVEPVNPLSELEPTAASVAGSAPALESPAPAPEPSEPRGLQWYLKGRAGAPPANPPQSPTPAASSKPELLGYDQLASSPLASTGLKGALGSTPEMTLSEKDRREQSSEANLKQRGEGKKEAELFAYMAGESPNSEETTRPTGRLRRAILAAAVLAACAIVAAPQAPWHPKLRLSWGHAQQSLRGWLNPQPVTPVQAPVAHEDFARAGDEYKLPVAESIPDATTDPSQIQVLPVVDPTIKKSNPLGGNAEQPQGPEATPGDEPPAGSPAPESQSPPSTPGIAPPNNVATDLISTAPSPSGTPSGSAAPALVTSVAPARSGSSTLGSQAPGSQPVVSATFRPVSQPRSASAPGTVPSSLKSQLAPVTPDPGGNKAPETAMLSIEPVAVSEAAELALVAQQPAVDYPASAHGQKGTVVLQVLIGRDGTVQDAKFMQGSLVFARSAIDGVKQWRFKPYSMNGRPVSVQTLLTISFKPTS